MTTEPTWTFPHEQVFACSGRCMARSAWGQIMDLLSLCPRSSTGFACCFWAPLRRSIWPKRGETGWLHMALLTPGSEDKDSMSYHFQVWANSCRDKHPRDSRPSHPGNVTDVKYTLRAYSCVQSELKSSGSSLCSYFLNSYNYSKLLTLHSKQSDHWASRIARSYCRKAALWYLDFQPIPSGLPERFNNV